MAGPGLGPGLGSSSEPLRTVYDTAVLDLDGVVYVGPDAVPGAPEALNEAREHGMHLAFVTNNAARPPAEVGEHLRELGVDARDDDVVTSAQAAARLLSEDLSAGAKVFVIGGAGLAEALRERDLEPVTTADGEVAAVVQGYGPEVPWKQVILGSILVRSGLPWVASNTDLTMPTADGLGPGNGTLVRLVAEFAGREPRVAGKPESPLLRETLLRVGGERPLMIGDRLDTDIAGAARMGWDSLLVLTGVTGLAELVAAEAECRPTYVAPDLSALADPQPVPEDGRLGGWEGSVEDGSLRVSGAGSPADWWRVVAEVSWRFRDTHDQPVGTDGVEVPG